jgi:uncharacterized small protein (DUF1192 family)
VSIDPAAVLAVISEQAQRIAALEAENAQLRAALAPPPVAAD